MGWRDTTLTIAIGATESEVLDLSEQKARRIKNMTFWAPQTLPETISVHVAKTATGTFKALNDGFGNDAVLPANKAVTLAGISAGALKLVANGAVAAERVFEVEGAAQRF